MDILEMQGYYKTMKKNGLVKSQSRHLASTELQDDTTSPPAVSWLFTTPTMVISKNLTCKGVS